jgi:hypothetical protein
MPRDQAGTFLFVHIPKTGGSAIERALGVYGLDNAGSNTLDAGLLFGRLPGGGHAQHLGVPDLLDRGYVSEDELERRLVFTFVRNPWDRFVSEYLYLERLGRLEGRSFERFALELPERVAAGDSEHLRPQSELTHRGGACLVDRIGRYEALSQDFGEICSALGLEGLPELPPVKMAIRRHYSAYYSDRSRAIVASAYAKDVELFGYHFETLDRRARLEDQVRHRYRQVRRDAGHRLVVLGREVRGTRSARRGDGARRARSAPAPPR